jgi:hypothetical protein
MTTTNTEKLTTVVVMTNRLSPLNSKGNEEPLMIPLADLLEEGTT